MGSSRRQQREKHEVLGEGRKTYGDGVDVALGSASNLNDGDLEVTRVRGIAASRSGGLRRDGRGDTLGEDVGDAHGEESESVDSLHLDGERERLREMRLGWLMG